MLERQYSERGLKTYRKDLGSFHHSSFLLLLMKSDNPTREVQLWTVSLYTTAPDHDQGNRSFFQELRSVVYLISYGVLVCVSYPYKCLLHRHQTKKFKITAGRSLETWLRKMLNSGVPVGWCGWGRQDTYKALVIWMGPS